MPAVTIDNLDRLPRLAAAAPTGRPRSVVSVTTAPHDVEGLGFPVRRAFAGVDLAALDPFVHLDQMGEVHYAPGEAKGTPWHPHRGFETVTYMIDGIMEHADSTGGGGRITNGDTQWMTAGSGLLHIEAPPSQLVTKGGLFHGLQLWVNLPAAKKWTAPRYQHIDAGAVRLLTGQDGASLVRIIAGALDAERGPGVTHTPINMVHATLHPDALLTLPWPSEFNALVYVLNGEGRVGPQERPISDGQLAVMGSGDTITIANRADASRGSLDVVVLGGEPIREPVAWYGPFVMNTDDEIRQAIEDFRAGRLGTIPESADP